MKLRIRYYKFRIWYLYRKIISMIKHLIKPHIPLNPEDAIIITKIDWKDFPYEKFKWKIKLSTGGYHFDKLDVSDKVRDGHFRKNVFYSWNYSGIPNVPFYISRVDGYYKIEKHSTINDNGIHSYQVSNMINNILIKFVRVTHTYRHKPLQELFELVVAQEELESL